MRHLFLLLALCGCTTPRASRHLGGDYTRRSVTVTMPDRPIGVVQEFYCQGEDSNSMVCVPLEDFVKAQRSNPHEI